VKTQETGGVAAEFSTINLVPTFDEAQWPDRAGKNQPLLKLKAS
jgi:hypothetical protein